MPKTPTSSTWKIVVRGGTILLAVSLFILITWLSLAEQSNREHSVLECEAKNSPVDCRCWIWDLDCAEDRR